MKKLQSKMYKPEIKIRMEWQNEKGCMVRGALATVIRLSQLCGLAPVTMLKKRSGYYITLSPNLSYTSGCFSVVLSVLSAIALIRDLTLDKNESIRVSTSMTAAVFITEMILINLVVNLGVLGAPSRIRQLINIRNVITKVESHLDADRNILSEKKVSAGVILFLVGSFTLLVLDYFLNIHRAYLYSRNRTVAFLYTSFFIQYAMAFILQFQFILIALSVQKSIEAMNDSFNDISLTLCLKAFHENKDRSMAQINKVSGREPVFYQSLEFVNCLIDSLSINKIKEQLPIVESIGPSMTPHEAVGRLEARHCLLCDVVTEINSNYGLILVTFLLIFLIHLIMSPYYLILQLHDVDRKFYKLLLQFLWCLFHMVNMFIMVEPCHRTTEEFIRTQELVSRLMRRLGTNSSQLAMQLEMFSRQLLLRRVHYSPLGMCKLNRPLITSIIGGVTTYLVILIQFQQYAEINGSV